MSFPLRSAPATDAESSHVFKALHLLRAAPNAAEADPEFIVGVWTTSEGLPINEIQDLKQTPDGYLWLGTHQGLIRFDGVRFDSFFNVPVGQRYGTHVEPLEIDARGRLWFAQDQTGVSYRDESGFHEVLTNGVLSKVRIMSLCFDGVSTMYSIDANGHAGKFSVDHVNEVEHIAGAGHSPESRWIYDYRGHLWLVSPRTLKVLRKDKLVEIKLRRHGALLVAPRRAGGLWIVHDGKIRFVTQMGPATDVIDVPWRGKSRATCLLEDKQGRLWIGTAGQGLYCYVGGELREIVHTSSGIECLLQDDEENIWVGTRGGGLMRVRQRQFFIQDSKSGLKNEFVRSLAQDKEGRLWMLTDDAGVGWWFKGEWHACGPEDGWPGHDSLSVLPAKDGSVWISTIHRGLWRWAGGNFSKCDLGADGPKEPVSDLLEDRKGRLWMVTDNSGIFCVESNKVTRYSKSEGLPSFYIRRLIEDQTGEIWAADWEGAIVHFRDGKWEMARNPSGHRDAVRAMVAHDGALWIGTSAGGLLRVKDGKTVRISVEQGLPDVRIQQLLFDGADSLWGGTPHQLFQIPLAQLNAVAEGKIEKINPITYGHGDGLPELSFANWCDPRSWHADNGELWFATANGALHFQPAGLHESKMPQIVLDQALLDGKPISAAALQQLRSSSGRLEFRYTAPCLTAPERVHFRYQLTGVDPDWVDAGSQRTVTYASIPDGKHEFRVIASSPEGVWGMKVGLAAIAMRPYFWQTNWFFAFIAALVAGGAVWIIRRATVKRLRWRLEKLHQQHAIDQERARIAQDIHDELGANLTSIGLLADMGMRHKFDSVAVGRELRQISEAARESVTAMDAIVWTLNPRNDSLDHFANYLAQFTRDFFRPTNLRTRLDLPTTLPALPMTTETRHQLLLIVKECFNNVVRHACASEVELQLACEGEQLRLAVADDGKGLTARSEGAGHDGLVNLQGRIERLGGTLRIETKDGRGTRLEFSLPITKLKCT